MAHLNMKTILDQVYTLPNVRIYLPDYEKDVVKRMNRDFLYHIINKLDPKFFTKAVEHLE